MIKIEGTEQLTTCVFLGCHIFHRKQENTDWKSIHSFLGSASVEVYLCFQSMETKNNLRKIKIFHAKKHHDIFLSPLQLFLHKAQVFFLMQLIIVFNLLSVYYSTSYMFDLFVLFFFLKKKSSSF